jgi:iron complex transport system substrate-binding protein
MGRNLKITLTSFALLLLAASPSLSATYRDALGREITLASPPQRIIPLAPNLTEILYALGLGDRVVGVTTFSTYPEEARTKPHVGSYIHPNLEKILSLSPELVIGTMDGNSRFIVDLLEQAGIKVFLVNPRDVAQTLDTIELLGRVCGAPEEGEEIASSLKRRVDRVRERVGDSKEKRVFLQINIRPIMTVTRNTIHNDIIRLSGGINIFQDEPITYPRINIEDVISRSPEVIIISSMERGGPYEETRKEWMKWGFLPAVKEGRVHLIDSDIIDRPSPRIVEGLEQIARLIHPEIEWN